MYKNNTGLLALRLEQGHYLKLLPGEKGHIKTVLKVSCIIYTCISSVAVYSCVMIKNWGFTVHIK